LFKRINLLTDEIKVSNGEFTKALNSKKEFGIDINGDIVYEKSPTTILIFWGRPNLLMRNQILGKDYRVNVTFSQVSISMENGWSKFLELNQLNSLYEDTSSDGIDHVNDEKMEESSWHGVEFGVTSRDIAEELERSCEGYVVALEREEPYSFDGLGFLKEGTEESARETIFNFVKGKVEAKIAQKRDEFDRFGFSEEESEALQYFGIAY
jgi:hypothetical protein